MSCFLRKVRVALTPRGWLLRRRLSNGAVVCGQNRAGYGGRGIYIFGDAIEPELQFLERFLDAEGVFVDVGANTGIYSLKAAKHYRNMGTVLSVEPFPDILASLYYSVRVNGFTNVRLRNLCLSDRTGPANLWLNHGRPSSSGLVKKDKEASSMSVLTVTLDDLLEWEGLDRLDYLKIDVEGAERQVLQGAANAIRRHRPIIQIEANPGNVCAELEDYRVFHPPGSPNRVLIPSEHKRVGIPKELGWNEMSE